MAAFPFVSRDRARGMAMAAMLAAGLAVSACSFSLGSGSDEETASAPSPAATEAPTASADDEKATFGRQADPDPIEENQVSAFKLRVGDCLSESATDTQVESVGVVPCSSPHGREVYALVDLEDGPFPAEEELIETVEIACYDEFEPFVGIDYASSRFYMSYLYPTESSWADGDREVVCMLFDPEGDMTGSARGTAE
ncbi:septum formation family protein [Hoyosella sp. G463]|uniref:Septum formation family protein n=1 Tax=Lolliginicoccus lacisalsi TaxID=2742202 RepID=A0A927PL44_9ACTN|nr:septum formation family protein [Lolliginicoccus lacisalsi]MBD8505012.1 septum formation family protein [Lolliginicoccus lacisalsi]